MMNKMMSKKAVSEIISYVLLIIVAMSISILVFAFLKVQIPKEKIECNEQISLIIKNHACVVDLDTLEKKVSITFQNKGNFKIDGAFIRFSESADSVTNTFLKPVDNVNTISSNSNQWGQGFFYFGLSPTNPPVPLNPNREYTQNFSYTTPPVKIQIQPFLSDEETDELTICDDKIITQEIVCS